jgi:Raf kinase inhibitor-like YbhB/YbcL family protein
MVKPLFALAALLCAACAGAQDRSGAALAFDRPETATQGRIEVTSSDFSQGGTIPDRFSSYREGVSPALAWTPPPAGTASLALFVEDPDASSARPFVHWLAWNVDPAAGGLPQNVGPGPQTGKLAGMVQGTNGRGGTGYFGPHPPGSKPHRYVFQLFALDTKLTLPAGAKRADLLAAMARHVLAKGQLMGLYRKPG